MKTEIIVTLDGSHTLFVPELNEHYHSVYGALSESTHVFIEAGLKYLYRQGIKTLRILEVGMGTGLNVLLSSMAAKEVNCQVHYTALEPYPMDVCQLGRLNFPLLFEDTEVALKLFKGIHSSPFEETVLLERNFTLVKRQLGIEFLPLIPEKEFNLVYYDAFAPKVHPHLWTESIFRSIYASLAPGGVLITYSSKGTVKQALRQAGFQVKRLTGPPGKHHMVRAQRIVNPS